MTCFSPFVVTDVSSISIFSSGVGLTFVSSWFESDSSSISSFGRDVNLSVDSYFSRSYSVTFADYYAD